MTVRGGLAVTLVLSCSWAAGCGSPGLVPVVLETEPAAENQLQLTENKDVDILFVIDNSGSMGAEQANLAANFGAFIEVLEANDVEANYRIGITTTDNGNSWCPPGSTTPEAGNLVLSSCRERLGDFIFNNGEEDVSDLACNDICTLDAAALEIQPTLTQDDANPKPRPWLERIEGFTNIPAGTSTFDAFRCFGPQGINGCGFESPLESMYLALTRARNPDEDSYGFMRSSALLAVVFVTDEADCSYNKSWASIFEPDGNQVFWADPADMFPSSAVCWNAGVDCVGDPSGYDSCDPVDKDVDGDPTTDPSDAVLHPLSRYVAQLGDIEQDKQALNAESEVIVALIGGVQPDGSLVYADVGDSDPAFQHDFGIGPGCTGPLGEAAAPPARLRDFTNSFTPDNLHSICATDYTGALEAIADQIRSKIIPACYYKCGADTNPDTELIDAICEVEQDVPGFGVRDVPECLRDAVGAYAVDPASGSYVMPSTEDEVCFAARTDVGGQSDDALDDIAEYCVDLGANVEFQLAYAAGVLPPSGASTVASCVVSAEPAVDCPELN
ncbi:vWA domain-containing protein [Enhygromyxa salina]|nr:vWA domain-containing protein [Enhygromyxa salina]